MRAPLLVFVLSALLAGCSEAQPRLVVRDDVLAPARLDLDGGTLRIAVADDVRHQHHLVYGRDGDERVHDMFGGLPVEAGQQIEYEIGFGDFQVWCQNHGTRTSGMTARVTADS